ncbi:unnamed protein product, partial [Oikopleura dioica]
MRQMRILQSFHRRVPRYINKKMLHLRKDWPSERRLPFEDAIDVKKLKQGSFGSAQKALGSVAAISHIGPKLLAHGQLFDQHFMLQIDTGAQFSLIPEKYISPKYRSQIIPSNIHLQAYDGSAIRTFGAISADLRIGKITLKKSIFLVVENHCTPILGTPEIEENEIIIDTKNRKITQKMNSAEIYTADVYGLKSGEIKAIERKTFFTTQGETSQKIVIGPKTTSVLNPRLNSTPTNLIYAIPEKITSNKNIEIYPQCVQINRLDASVNIQIGNNSALPVTFEKNAVICRLAEVSIGITESGKLENVMKELQIGNAPAEIKRKLKKIVGEFVDVFAIENEKLGTTDAMHYKINTGNAAPVASQRYKTPYYLRNELKKIIDNHVKSGLLEPISSPWAAPVLLVKKPN